MGTWMSMNGDAQEIRYSSVIGSAGALLYRFTVCEVPWMAESGNESVLSIRVDPSINYINIGYWSFIFCNYVDNRYDEVKWLYTYSIKKACFFIENIGISVELRRKCLISVNVEVALDKTLINIRI